MSEALKQYVNEIDGGYYDDLIRCLIDKHHSNDKIVNVLMLLTSGQYSSTHLESRIGLLKNYDIF